MPQNNNPIGLRIQEVELHGIGNTHDYERGELRKRSSAESGYPDLQHPIESYQRLDILTQNERVWINRLIIAAFLDLGVSFVVSVLSFSIAYQDRGYSLYCIGFQSMAHLLSSLTIIIRFFKESSLGKYGNKDGRSRSGTGNSENGIVTGSVSDTNPNSEDSDQIDESLEGLLLSERKCDYKREQYINIALGVIFLLSASVLFFKSAMKFRFWEKWHQDLVDTQKNSDSTVMQISEILAWKSGAVYCIQGLLRYFSRRETGEHKFINHVMWVSFMSCIFCFVLGIGASFQKQWSWKAEPIVCSILAIFCCVEGMRIIYVYFDDIDDLMLRHQRP